VLCPICNSCGCEEECVEYCLNCDKEIELNKEFCSDLCKKDFESDACIHQDAVSHDDGYMYCPDCNEAFKECD
jgi:hypothetical protein